MYDLLFTPDADMDLESLRRNEQVAAIAAIEANLRHEPTAETRNRKRLRPNPVADWELRAGRLRVLYNVEEDAHLVQIEAVGLKAGNLLFVRGRRTEL